MQTLTLKSEKQMTLTKENFAWTADWLTEVIIDGTVEEA